MKYIIINADDFGLSDGVCKSIIELFDANAITNTSLMVAAPNAITTIKNWGGEHLLGLAGVHLTLTGGKPLTPISEIPSLVDPISGKFKDPRVGSLPIPDQVEKEWRLQISIACDLLGGLPTHLDSHHGAHRIPELFEIYRRLADELGIPMRGAVSGAIRNVIEEDHLTATVAIVRDWTGRFLDAPNLKDQIATISKNNPKEIVIELVTHPGYNDSYLESVSSFSAARENDHAVLLDLAQQGWWTTAGYKLISYRDFNHGID
jgi:predicted glycoside hydrolase/deacetylase ChbG (UPF0249 family)